MLISEIQCEESTGDMAAETIDKLTNLVADIEKNVPLGNVTKKSSEEIRHILGTVPSTISSEQRLALWRLSFQIWNACVEHTNGLEGGKSPSTVDALLRHIASDMLLVAGENPNVKSSLMKMAAFFHRTGVLWHDLKEFVTAETCFTKANELILHMREDFASREVEGHRDEKKEYDNLNFEILTDRSKTAWQMSRRELATSLLERASSILINLPDRATDLAENYLYIGRFLLSQTEEKNSTSESVIYLEKAWEVCTKALSGRHLSGQALSAASSLKNRVLRYLAGAHVQNEDWEAAMKCTAPLKACSDHACIPYLELKALAGSSRLPEAASRLEALVSHKGCTTELAAAGLDALLSSKDIDSVVPLVKNSFFDLHSRFPADTKLVLLTLEKLLRGTVGVSNTSKSAIEMALEAVNAQSISGLIGRSSKQKQNGVNDDQKCVFALLWNAGTGKFHVKDWKASQALFEATMMYIPEDDAMMQAKILCLICLCCLGDGRQDQAKWFVDEAEKLDSSIASTFLKFKIALQSNSLEEASAQVKKMSTCRDFEPDFLTLASHEAVASNQAPVAVAALCSLLALDFQDQASKVKDAIVLRNIISLLSEKMGKGAEDILPYYRQAQERLDVSTVADFCGDGTLGEQEGLWFAASALDHGLQLGKDGKWRLSSEFIVVAAAFYAALPGSPENLRSEKLALILASSVLLENGETESNSNLQANKFLERCKTIFEKLSMSGGMTADEATTEMHYYLLLFNVKRRLGDSKAQEDVLNRCKSLPSCTYDHFLVMAQQASEGKGSDMSVARAAYMACLTRILESMSPDHKALAQIVRKLIRLVDSFDKSGQEVLDLYIRAEGIVRGLHAGVYPKEEAQWLVSTAWNRGVMHSNFDEFDQAEKWMEIAIKLRRYASGMESSEAMMTNILKQVRLDKVKEELCVE